jgi:hypothetical protein
VFFYSLRKNKKARKSNLTFACFALKFILSESKGETNFY